MLRAIIIDDEKSGIVTLKILIEKIASSIRVVASTTSAEEGIILIEDYKPDIVFLDISMPIMSGFELLNKIKYKDFKLVFTTAHQEYALKAIKNKAFDYLLKPIDVDDFKTCIGNIVKFYENDSNVKNKKVESSFIELSVKDGIIFIKPPEIIRLEASRSYTIFYLEGNIKHVASKNLKEFETHLDTETFYRCHNSHIVNLKKIIKFENHDGFFAQMSDGSKANVSKNCKDILLEKLKNI